LINPIYNNNNANNIKRKKIVDVLSEMEEIARKDYLPSIGPIKGKIIGDIIKKYKPKRILEIGTLHGYSAILMANFLLSVNDNDDNDNATKEFIVVCLEIDKKLANIAKKNIEKAGLSDKIKVINGDALEIIPILNNNNHYRFDLVFIDAVKNQYLEYLKLIEENDLMNKEEAAIVIADNVLIYENEMRDYLDYVRNSGQYNSYTTETTLEFTKNVKDALEVSIRANLD
jgi:predicted O-methyltransferase YrrM